MSQTWIISGPPGCGKTSWILNTFKNHSGNCGYVRLGGYSEINLEQAINSKIDFAFLKDQIPNLLDLSSSKLPLEVEKENILRYYLALLIQTVIEVIKTFLCI